MAVASGVMLGLAFRVPALASLDWVALVPLLVATRRLSSPGPRPRGGELPRVASWGFIAGLTFFGILLYWTYLFGPSAVIGLVGYMLVWMVLFAVGAWRLSGARLGWRILATPSLWVLLEWIRSAGTYGFPWGVLGYSQQPIAPVAQFVSLAGVFGLSWVLVLVNTCLTEIALAEHGERRTLVASGAITLAAMVVVLGWGIARGAMPVAPPWLPIAGVQPSIDQWAKFDASQADMIMRTLNRLSKRALRARPGSPVRREKRALLNETRLLIWPETVMPVSDGSETQFVRAARARAARAGVDFLFGSFARTPHGISNSAFLSTPLGSVTRYGKVHLVPFGEFVPLRRLIGNIGLLSVVKVDQAAAYDPVLLPSSRGPIGTVICFESSDEVLVRRVVGGGAQLLVVITNDGWFDRTAVSDQHFRITAMRAIENGIYTVQVSNNGISGIIDPRGRILVRTGLWDRTVMYGRVALGSEATPYRALGSWPILALSCVVLLLAAGSLSRRGFLGAPAG